jgi:hypothetical protein
VFKAVLQPDHLTLSLLLSWFGIYCCLNVGIQDADMRRSFATDSDKPRQIVGCIAFLSGR